MYIEVLGLGIFCHCQECYNKISNRSRIKKMSHLHECLFILQRFPVVVFCDVALEGIQSSVEKN